MQDTSTDFFFSLHLHKDRKKAFANRLVGYEEGIRDFDSFAAALGGCLDVPNASGNIASEDLINGIQEMGVTTGETRSGTGSGKRL